MSIFNSMGSKFGEVLSFIEERNRKKAELNRIRSALKREERAASTEYIALGRYYYANLREKSNAVTEIHCDELDKIELRMNAAISQLERYYEEEAMARAEEVTLEDVQCINEEDITKPSERPVTADAAAAEPAATHTAPEAADTDENDNLPFGQ